MSKNESLKGFFGDIHQHLMTGVSFMLPAIIVYAFFMVTSQIGGSFGEFSGVVSEYAHMLIVPIIGPIIKLVIISRVCPPFVFDTPNTKSLITYPAIIPTINPPIKPIPSWSAIIPTINDGIKASLPAIENAI